MTLSEQDKARIRAEEEFRQQVRNETATQTESYVDRRAREQDVDANAHAIGKLLVIPIFIVGIVLFSAIGDLLHWVGNMFSWLTGR